MSNGIKVTEVTGDLTVTRNTSVGGDASVKGSATVGGNLTVKGWLDAKNIKGPSKGLFKTIEQLRAAYANPHDGWWALVGDGFPAAVWHGDGGEWVAMPGDSGQVVVDSSEYAAAVQQMTEDLETVNQGLNDHVKAYETFKENTESDIRSLRTAADNAQSTATSAQQTAEKAQSTADDALGKGTDALADAAAAQQTGDDALSAAESAQATADDALRRAQTAGAEIDALSGSVGVEGGIAPLDESGKVPSRHLPSYVDDTKEFAERTYGVAQLAMSEKASTDDGCEVVYDMGQSVFALRVKSDDGELYYYDWADGDDYGEQGTRGRIPVKDKIYVCTSENSCYRWSGTALSNIGSSLALGHTSETAYPGDEGLLLRDDVDELKSREVGIVPISGFATDEEASTGVWWVKSDGDSAGHFYFAEIPDGYDTYDYVARNTEKPDTETIYKCGNELYRYDGKSLVKIGGASVGNCYNVTVNIPKAGTTDPYYNLEDAVKAVAAEGMAALGLQITFAVTATSWKFYQYIGKTTEQADFTEVANWIDLAGMSAGAEAIINVNAMCDDKVYTQSTALQAIIDKEQSAGVTYRKKGVIMTYKVGHDDGSGKDVWQTKQYCGEVSDCEPANEALWKDFGEGGGISEVEVTDTPKADDDTPLSAGGAYAHMIADFEETQDGENIYYQAVNGKQEPIGNKITIPKSSGGGASSGTSMSISFKDNPLYASVSGDIKTSAAIRSVTYEGENEIPNTIKHVEIQDATTGVALWSSDVNQASSSSVYDYSFGLDFTSYFSAAASKEFSVVATDDSGNKRTKSISVVAVDATIQSVQTLNYTSTSVVEAGGSTKSILMYKFPNNASKTGIKCVTEIYYDGEWKKLGEATVTDTYSKSISVNPNNLLGGGEKLSHGAYAVRMQGEDVASGVKGNMLYSGIFCIDKDSDEAMVAVRYSDSNDGKIRLYDTVEIELAAYTPGKSTTQVSVMCNDERLTTITALVGQTHSVTKQVQGFKTDGSQTITFVAVASASGTRSGEITLTVSGSAIDAELKEGALFGYDFSSRTNSETDHTISDSGKTMSVNGANWSSNGFANYLGENCLRIAENVTAEIPYVPFSTSVEQNGMALQMAFATKNIKDADALLMECYDEDSGAGFYIKGNAAGIYCVSGNHQREERSFKCGEKITLAVVVEPSYKYVERSSTKYAMLKMYLNGEEVACIGYVPSTSALINSKNITLGGAAGDLYLYYFLAYESHYEWAQAFRNYLVKLTDASAMIEEYENEDVLDTQGRPSLDLLKAKGVPYYVVVADQGTFDTFDSGTSTSELFSCTLYYFNPDYPCLNFKATDVLWRRQGTTSAKRPVKNDRFNLNKKNKNTGKKATLTLLNADDSTEIGRNAIEAAKINKVFVKPNGLPVDIITVKVDYSDSSNANDCGVCDMMNATFRALGDSYMTPAQRYYDGTFDSGSVHLTEREMDHSTKNHPIAAFRATSETLQDAWFHAKANWKEDKGEQVALGFKDTPGYNKGCKNYQDSDFVEFFGTKDETLNEIESRFKSTTGLDTSKMYLLSQYCGRDYRFMRYNGGWAQSSGSMKQVNGEWVVTGDVLNPVCGFELLNYQGMDWFQGVGSVDDMMEMKSDMSSWVKKLVDGGSVSATTFPAWTFYFECMVDNDQLQIDLALGKKVPYELYNLLRFCDSCDYSKYDTEVWNKTWRENAYRYMSLESAFAYTAFTDYLAAVDQRAKNMQPMWFMEDGCTVEDGVYSTNDNGVEPLRMYLNKVYDCDTCNKRDNDGGCTVDAEADPNRASDETYTNPYAGWGSVLFNNIAKCSEVWNDKEGTLISLRTVVANMRSVTTTIDGERVKPFSPDGAQYFFVEKRLKFWSKLVSSYDGERKYIQFTPTSDAIYFYALQGLGLTSLPAFIEQRWRIRDGYFQTGDFFSGVLSGRIACESDATISIRAAKSGYFGLGNDASGNLSESVYLEAGESYTFTNFSHETGALLYIYQADRMSEIDLSEISLDSTFDFSIMALAEKIVVGGESHKDKAIGSYNALGSMPLGDLPFLRELDVRNTTATNVDATSCPRIETILAGGSKLTSCTIAETSPISRLELPGTMTTLCFVNLPKLSYPGGLTVESMTKVSRVVLQGCEKIDETSLISGIIESSSIRYIRMADVMVTASKEILKALKECGAIGLDQNGNAYDESGRCSGLTGRWILSELADDSELKELQEYFPELNVYNSQYSYVVMDDTADDTANISNPENMTGYDYDKDYEPSGHISRINDKSKAYKSVFNSKSGKMVCTQLSDSDYTLMADGSGFDPTDNSGEGYDVMKLIPDYWYKGVNDFKNQRKYYFVSSNGSDDEPLSTSGNVVRCELQECVEKRLAAIFTTDLAEGDEYELSDNPNMNVHSIDVDGMKQVRWPGVNNSNIGAVFTDEDGRVVSTFNMTVSYALFDFSLGDYIFCDVPGGAKRFVFTAPTGYDTLEVIAVDSSEIEAIEPDWVFHKRELCGVYGLSVDGLLRPRSVSGAKTKTGTGTATTNAEWKYDSEGNVTNETVPTSTMNYTCKDFMNLCNMRGTGYFAIDYEMSKDIANLVMAIVGDRDIQAVCGYGTSSGYTTGAFNAYGNMTRRSSSGGNLIFGIQNFVGCNYEWMDNVAVNVVSFAAFKKNKCNPSANDTVNAIWHIYNAQTKTERTVQGINSSGYCIARVKHGRYCDVIASRCSSDNSKWNMNYSDAQYYSASTGRVVGRSYCSASASGGLVCANASNVSSNSNSSYGARLAFRGEIAISEEA